MSETKNGPIKLIPYILSGSLHNFVALPFMYGMIFPLLILDVSVVSYQAICFRLFKIPRVKRSDYIAMKRHRLGYLNILEKINCDYCGYANGLVAFTREIFARTEQYFCPVKHANRVIGAHERYEHFLRYGDAENFPEKLEALRQALLDETKSSVRHSA